MIAQIPPNFVLGFSVVAMMGAFISAGAAGRAPCVYATPTPQIMCVREIVVHPSPLSVYFIGKEYSTALLL